MKPNHNNSARPSVQRKSRAPIVRRERDNHNQSEPVTSQDKVFPDLVPVDPSKKVRVISIGGLGEIGKNTWVFECEEKILIVDAGLGFPNDSMHGIDLVLPDLTYLVENKEKIAGMVITHGHEDHIGGIPNLLRAVDIPIIYGPPLAVGLVEVKLKEHGLLQKANLKRYKPRDTVQIGPFAVTFARNNHSIPDSFSLVIQSPAGLIVHSGDFKFDHTPVDGELFDIATLAEARERGVTLLISDSTNAEKPGYTPSEKQVYANIEEAFIRAHKRIIITTFASQVHRIRQILEISQKYGKKVAILGRSMLNIALVARQLGYMNFPDGLLIRADEASHYPLNKIVILTTGSQGEPLSALTRISNGTHKQISIIPGDTVIMSASPIPGNERSVASTINALFSRGAQVVYGKEAGVHVSGHCSQEEQKIMFSLTRPKFFMPAHGEFRMLVAHGKLAEEVLGLSPENVFVMENGDVLEISSEQAQLNGKVAVGILMVNSNDHSNAISEETVQKRFQMSTQGVMVINLTINEQKQIVAGPRILTKGVVFADDQELQTLLDKLGQYMYEQWPEWKKLSLGELEGQIRQAAAAHCAKYCQKPLIQPVILQASLV